MKSTLNSSLNLPVEVIYEILPAEFGLPEQVDIVAVNIKVRGPTGRKRTVDVLSMLDEAEVFRLEDETDQGE